MALLVDLTDQAKLIQTLIEKSLIQTEEINSGDYPGFNLGDGANEATRNLLDFHIATLELKRLAGDLHRIAEDLLTGGLGTGRRTIDGTTIDIRRAYKRSDWEHSKLATHVALRALGGEMIEGMDVVVDAFLKACNPSWRVTVLKEMGLSDDQYCSRELGRATVTVL